MSIAGLDVVLLLLAAADGGTAVPRPAPSLLAPMPAAGEVKRDGAREPSEYQLRRTKDGSGDLLYEAPGWRARVATDGDVRFEDRSVSNLSFLPWLPQAVGPRGTPSLQTSIGWLLGIGGKRRPGPPERQQPPPPDGPPPFQVIPQVTPFRPDPREACRLPNCGFDAAVLIVSATGAWDLTDQLMRTAHQDPYRLQKARFLAATRDLRVALAARAHADNLRRARGDLPRRLAEIACDQRLTRDERRAILAALADEMDGTADGSAAAAEIRRFLAERFDAPDGLACPPPPRRPPD